MNDAFGSPQSVLVLGGGSDIARAIVAKLVARQCGLVVLAGRDPDHLREAASEARALGAGTVVTEAFDATEISSHQAFVDRVFAEHGPFDLVLVAFGVLGDQAGSEREPEKAARVITTNFTGAATVGLAVASKLRAQGQGTIVALSSVAGERARRANFVYGASKAGMDAFYQGLGDSLVGSGARVVVVRPGFVRSKMTAGMPAAPMATTPSEVAGVVVAALSSGAEIVWAPPRIRFPFAVMRHLPRSLFRRIKT